ncbi:MAG: hypothetical protein CL610_04970 [Anaerolineaceae bacterium]|nr:hypothetical protein [Anaerolineaceae bacterium]
MQITRKTLYTLAATVLLLLSLQAVLADERINQVHHFGGDTLYCTQADGCWLVNMQGETLWEVSQATIDDALAAACETGTSGYIEAGMGTYGPSTIGVSCYLGYDPSLKLIGYDEWGKVNTMLFPTTYEPVYAPPMELPEPTAMPPKSSG